jgi:gamma-glutamyltranspeptidase
VDVIDDSAGAPSAEPHRRHINLRTKGVLACLSDERKAALHEWLKNPAMSYLQICSRIKTEWNLQVWPKSLTAYYARFVADEVIEERQKSVGVVALVNEDIDKNPADYAKAILDALGDKTFDSISNPSAQSKVVAHWVQIFNNLRASEKNLELRERDLAAKERELTLKEKKFEDAQRTIADPKLSAAEIGARCRKIFGEQADANDDGQEFLPAFFENRNSAS